MPRVGLLLAVVATAGCSRPVPAPGDPTPVPIERHAAVYERAATKFLRGALILPLEDSVPDATRWMCPLLLQEIPADDPAKTYRRFGALEPDPRGQPRVNTDRLTAYLWKTAVAHRDRQFAQWTLFWFYPPREPDGPPRWRGVRMTLSPKGFAMIWELLSDSAEQRVLFVAKQLEEAAAGEFGGPLPGRRWAVERAPEEQPGVVVVRAVGEAPQPLGPIVYLDHAELQITNVLCRCEPAQVTDFAVTTHYRVVTLDGPAAWDDLGAPPAVRAAVTRAPDLDQLLRLPAEKR